MRSGNIVRECLTCPLRGEHFFCDLSSRAVGCLNDVKSAEIYPRRTQLFSEGQPPRGVFVLCTGRAKLSTSSREGKTIITKIAQAGSLLGLNAVIANREYEVTAEMMEPGQASFIPRRSLLQMMKAYEDVALAVAEELSGNYYRAHEEVCALGLANDTAERIAKLLLVWSITGPESDGSRRGSTSVKLTLTHEEIAETIGTTRQTVSRVFSRFRKKRMLQGKGSTFSICNRLALEKIVQF